jgi:5'-nucleotidase
MRIMLVNDDGYRAPGIRAMARALTDCGHDVTVCAPDRERSASSHAFTITSPLKTHAFEEGGVKGYAIDGTPADCARLGLFLLDYEVDMTISGINRGANIGGACVYSGTVGAAMEAAMCGCPAIATSLDSFTSNDYTAAAKITLKLLDWAVDHPLPMGAVYNLNVPALAYDEIKGVTRAKLAPVFLGEAKYEKRRAPYDFDYYWLVDGENVPITDPESDAILCRKGWATITALTWDIAHPGGMAKPDITL